MPGRGVGQIYGHKAGACMILICDRVKEYIMSEIQYPDCVCSTYVMYHTDVLLLHLCMTKALDINGHMHRIA